MKLCIMTIAALCTSWIYSADRQEDPHQQLSTYIENHDIVKIKILLEEHPHLQITNEHIKQSENHVQVMKRFAVHTGSAACFGLCQTALTWANMLYVPSSDEITKGLQVAMPAISTTFTTFFIGSAARNIKGYLKSRNVLKTLKQTDSGTYNELTPDERV